MRESRIDSFVRELVTKNVYAIVWGFCLLSSFVMRYHLMKHGSSTDFEGYIIPWIEQYRKSIPLAFKEGVGDYYIPYNILLAIASLIDIPVCYSVGTISCIFDYLTAYYIYKILSDYFGDKFNKTLITTISIIYLFVPTIVLNGATWKQCDAIYSFFCVVFLKCLMDGKIRTAFVMLGIAFSFKQQSLFVVPVLIILYFLDKRIHIVYFAYTLLVYLVAGLPAIIAGRPAAEVYTIYLGQATMYHQMTLNYPNLYLVGMTMYERMHIFAKLFTVFVFAMMFLYIIAKVKHLSRKSILVLAAWSVWTSCMFLPSMHQRYDYLVAVLLVVCVPLLIADNTWITIVSAVLFYIGNILTYSHSLYGDDYDNYFVICCNGLAYGLFCYMLWKCLKEDSKELATQNE